MQKLHTFFSAKNISVYAIVNDQSFNDTLTNDIVSFEQLGPGIFSKYAFICSPVTSEFQHKYDLNFSI